MEPKSALSGCWCGLCALKSVVAAGAVEQERAHPIPQLEAHLPPAAGPRRRRQDPDVCQHQPGAAECVREPLRAALCRQGQLGGDCGAWPGWRAPQHRQRLWRRRLWPGGLRPDRRGGRPADAPTDVRNASGAGAGGAGGPAASAASPSEAQRAGPNGCAWCRRRQGAAVIRPSELQPACI